MPPKVVIKELSHPIFFLASDFIRSEEIPPLFEKAEADGTKVIPVIIRKCLFKESILKDYHALNQLKKPLEGMTNAEVNDTLYLLTKEIDKVLL